MKTGIELIAIERQRQIEIEGYTPEHDAQYKNDELFIAASCYLAAERIRAINGPGFDPKTIPNGWPWTGEWWKPSPDNRIKELVKAGALYDAQNDVRHSELCISQKNICAAEIDRLQTKNNE